MAAGTPFSAPLVEEWDALADRAGAPFWLRPAWFAPWWAAFGRGDVETVEVRRAGALVGIAPFARRAGALDSLANWHTPTFELLAADDEARRELAAEAVRRSGRRLGLRFVPTHGRGLPEVRAAAGEAGRRLIVRTVERSPYVPLNGSWDAYEATLEAKLRSECRRRLRKLEAEGEVAFEVRDGGERLDTLVDEVFAVEAAAWKAARGTAIVSDPAVARFYRSIARSAAARGELALAFLRLDGRPLAVDFALVSGGSYALLKTGYDPELRRLAPGMLLRRETIRHAFERGLRSFEFLGSEAPWKREWTPLVRELKAVQAFAPSVAGAVDFAALRFGRPAAKRALALARR